MKLQESPFGWSGVDFNKRPVGRLSFAPWNSLPGTMDAPRTGSAGRRRTVTFLVLALTSSLFWTSASTAQTAPLPQAKSFLPDVSTTKILAIGSITASGDRTLLPAVMPDEVRDTVQLYLAGHIEQWFVRKDKPGVVFVLSTNDLTEARTRLASLPLVKSGLMTFELIPLGPLAPLGLLIPQKPR